MNPTEEKKEREAYTPPVVTDVEPVTVVKGQEGTDDNSGGYTNEDYD